MFLNPPKNSASPKFRHPLRAATGLVLQKLGLSERITLTRHGFRLPFFANSNLALTLWSDRDYHDPAENFASACLRQGDVVIDIGANIGSFAATAAVSVGNTGCVHAYEAHPVTFGLLRRTIEANGFTNVSCHHLAVSDRQGTGFISDLGRKDDSNHILHGGGNGIAVAMTTISAIMEQENLDHVDLLKIDVEGLELAVLSGIGDHAASISCIYVEVLPRTLARYGRSAADVKGWLREAGFELFRVVGDSDNIVAIRPTSKLRTEGLRMEPLAEEFE